MRAKRGVLLIGVAVTLALLVGSTALWAKQEGKGKNKYLPNEIPMTADFTDDMNDGIKSDGKIDPDPGYDDGVEGVRAVLVGARNFVLDTRNSPSRSFRVDLAGCWAAENQEIPTELLDEPIVVNFFSTARLIDNNGDLVEDRLLGMAVDDKTFLRSDAQVFFAIGDTQYFVRFDPDSDKGGDSEHVHITRLLADVWAIGSEGMASLLSQPLKGRPKTTLVANCMMPFELIVGCVNPEDCPAPTP